MRSAIKNKVKEQNQSKNAQIIGPKKDRRSPSSKPDTNDNTTVRKKH